MKVRIALYKASFANWTDALISGWTWLWTPFSKSYSHVEIGVNVADKWVYFSSSSRNTFIGGKMMNGTRWIDGGKLLTNRKRWDVYECDHYSNQEVQDIIDRANSILGKKYDWLGILGFITITGQILNARNKWYCSEACFFVLTDNWVKRISPRRMSKRVQKMGFKLCENV